MTDHIFEVTVSPLTEKIGQAAFDEQIIYHFLRCRFIGLPSQNKPNGRKKFFDVEPDSTDAQIINALKLRYPDWRKFTIVITRKEKGTEK